MTCRSTKNRFLADENEGQLSSLLHSVIVLFNSLNPPPPHNQQCAPVVCPKIADLKVCENCCLCVFILFLTFQEGLILGESKFEEQVTISDSQADHIQIEEIYSELELITPGATRSLMM